MKKIVTFGELMLRLMPENHLRFVQAKNFNVEFGGAEANVAVSLANFGAENGSDKIDSIYVTKLPENQLGQAALNSIRGLGVKTDFIVRGGDRLGIYFLEKGASQRGSLCIYDRKNSAIAESSILDFNWEEIFSSASWFHITGVTPALSKTCAEITMNACKIAKSKGLTVSCDLNYRSKLWSKSEARDFFTKLSPFIDICIANEEDALNVFGIETLKTDVDSGILDKDAYIKTAKILSTQFGFKKVAITLRQSINADNNNWSALLYDSECSDGDVVFSKEYSIHIVERVGSGDAFAAGLIFGLIKKSCEDARFDSNQKIVEFASAASCLKHSIEGDFNQVSVEEVLRLVNSKGTGRVSR